jgi:protein-disulfide isomerase
MARGGILFSIVLFGLFAGGCDGGTNTAGPDNPSNAQDQADAVVGVVSGEIIRKSEIESGISFQLFNLDLQRYRLLRQSLEVMAMQKLEDGGTVEQVAEIRLEPPAPPRVDVSIDPARSRPGTSAPVTVLVFCNFESPHCVRTQAMLNQVMPLFGTVLQQAARDFALPFHRNANFAAEAARCALEQGAYWQFSDLLYAGSGALNRQRVNAATRAALLDDDAFAQCLDSRRNAPLVAQDNEAARALALDQVPAIFVNGLYAGNSVDPAQLVWLIERELERQQITSPRQTDAAAPTAAPIRLTALLHSPWPGQGVAMLAPAAAPDQSGVFREGDVIGNSLIVRRITDSRVEFWNDGRIEWLTFGDAHLNVEVEPPTAEEALAIRYPHRAVPVTLDRDEVLLRLADPLALQEVLVTVPMKSGDYHQLRISEVRPGSLYELLGLEAGDVILGVNEQPVHEAENPLWDALEREGEVRVRVMRRGGLAQHYTYRFDE